MYLFFTLSNLSPSLSRPRVLKVVDNDGAIGDPKDRLNFEDQVLALSPL